MSEEDKEIEVIVTRPVKTIIVIEKDTNKVLFMTHTYNKKINPGRYGEDDIDEIVRLFIELASKGHKLRPITTNPHIIYRVIKQILRSPIPLADKEEELYKYIRSQR